MIPFSLACIATLADVAITWYAITSGQGSEANPLLGRQPWQIAAANVAFLAVVWVLMRGYPLTTQWWVWGSIAGLHTLAAGWNAYKLWK